MRLNDSSSMRGSVLRVNRQILNLFCLVIPLALIAGCVSSSESGRTKSADSIQSIPANEDASSNQPGGESVTETGQQSPPSNGEAMKVQVENEDGQQSGTEPVCPFRPVKMRIHPLTRVVASENSSEGSIEIEARIELVDQFGDTTKGLGDLRLELFASRSSSGTDPSGKALLTWCPAFGNLAFNALHFDRVTRTYVFALELRARSDLPSRCILIATLTTGEGVLADRLAVDLPAGRP